MNTDPRHAAIVERLLGALDEQKPAAYCLAARSLWEYRHGLEARVSLPAQPVALPSVGGRA